jgi:hypothetical protein
MPERIEVGTGVCTAVARRSLGVGKRMTTYLIAKRTKSVNEVILTTTTHNQE